MYKSGKRVYKELNTINEQNTNNPDSIKFLIDRTPFGSDDTQAPTIAETEHGKYYIINGRILPTSNTYNRSAFEVRLKVPIEYPFKSPDMEMVTPIYHPNIAADGKICIPMLRSTDGWKPTKTLIDVVNDVVNYIDYPNIDEAHSPGKNFCSN
jgi:ubiquitin-protein ligase